MPGENIHAPEDRNRALLELLMAVSRDVVSALDLRTVLQRLLLAALRHIGGLRGSIVVLDEQGRPVDATIVNDGHIHEQTVQQLREPLERGLAGWVVKHRKSVLLPDTWKDDRWLRRLDDGADQSGAKSAVCVPLLARDRLIGVLTLVHPAPNGFTADHLHLAQALADQASVAVLNARLYTESQRTARIMSVLAEAAVTINATLELPELWRRILAQTMRALQVETAALALVEPLTPDTQHEAELVYIAADGRNAGHIVGRRVPATVGLAGQVMHERRAVLVQDTTRDRRFGEADRIGGLNIRALIISPIMADGQLIGVLEAINPASGSFDSDATMVMVGLASLAGSNIQHARFLEQVRQSQRLYRELFEESIDPILITDWEGNVLEANRQALGLAGFKPDQIREVSIDQLHDVNWNRTGLNFEALRVHDICVYESVLFRQDGHIIPVEVNARRVQFEQSEALQWTLRDISVRRELSSLRDDMTGMIYQDLRSPLGNIISSLDILAGMLPPERTLRSLLEIAQGSAARIQRMLSSLLDITRFEAGGHVTTQKAADPLALIAEARRDVEGMFQSRRQHFEVSLPAALPLVWVDVDMIHRVLVNVLENASKYTQLEGHITLEAQATGVFVRLAVRDNGPGIAEPDHARVFEKFARVRSKEQAGMGIGLAFSKLAVEGHGGEMHLESELGKGSTFWFTLPVARQKTTSARLERRTGGLRMVEEKGPTESA